MEILAKAILFKSKTPGKIQGMRAASGTQF